MNCKNAAVIGTGMMGPGIASILALGGVNATILSRHEASALEGLEKARRFVRLLQAEELAGAECAELSCSTDMDAAVKDVDLVIESAPENMEFKQNLFAHLDSVTRPDAVLASNTSGLSITEIQSKCRHAGRVVTAHFWNPPHLMPLVEIVKGAQTSDEAAEGLKALLTHCGKVVVMVKKDTPGQLGNRLQSAVKREAMHIVAEGIASVEDVDLAIKNGFGLRFPVYGCFEHMDAVGTEMSFAISDYISRDLSNRVGAPPVLREMLDRGELGVKSGKGFYDWSEKSWDEVRELRDSFVLDVVKRWRKRHVPTVE